MKEVTAARQTLGITNSLEIELFISFFIFTRFLHNVLIYHKKQKFTFMNIKQIEYLC
jgi:hypothetical protein